MGQKKQFVVESQKKVDELTNLLIKLLPEFGINFINKGGGRSVTRPLDAALYDLHEKQKKNRLL